MTFRKYLNVCGIIIAVVHIAGCSESVLIRSLPAGATVTVNNRIIGTTPVVFSAPSKSLEQEKFHYHIEADSYRPADGTLEEHVSWRRIVGYIFTAGILRTCRGVKTFGDRPVEVVLDRVDAPPSASAGDKSDPTEQRLNHLKSLHDRGVISDEEYKKARGDVLHDIGQ